ncbi:MAG: hypothetical protein CM15mP84_06690 [Cellvibrionales bacterium]|nr:MAG: hypothetical protein CM15mP84_06690 [Cellvibrionales bacterium]
MGWLTETGRVVAIESDAVWVEADRSSACGKCAARAGVGMARWPLYCNRERGEFAQYPARI